MLSVTRWKVLILTYFIIPLQNIREETEEKLQKPQLGGPVSGPRFEAGSLQYEARTYSLNGAIQP
jgi:hypothetical protein